MRSLPGVNEAAIEMLLQTRIYDTKAINKVTKINPTTVGVIVLKLKQKHGDNFYECWYQRRKYMSIGIPIDKEAYTGLRGFVNTLPRQIYREDLIDRAAKVNRQERIADIIKYAEKQGVKVIRRLN